MSKILEYIKKNYLFVILIVAVITVLLVLIITNIAKKQQVNEYLPYYEEFKYDIKKHDANEYKIIEVSDEDIAESYYKNWIYLVVNKPQEAYNMLSQKSKKEYDSYEKFAEWIDQYKTKTMETSTLTGLKKKEQGGYNTYLVSTTDKMRYRFIEYSVWNYKVDIIGKDIVTTKTAVTKKAK